MILRKNLALFCQKKKVKINTTRLNKSLWHSHKREIIYFNNNMWIDIWRKLPAAIEATANNSRQFPCTHIYGDNFILLLFTHDRTGGPVYRKNQRGNSWTQYWVEFFGQRLKSSETRVLVGFSTFVFPIYKMLFMKKLESTWVFPFRGFFFVRFF